jgi:hypothetical protein
LVAITPPDALPSNHETVVQASRVLDKRGLSILVRPEYGEPVAKVRSQSLYLQIEILTRWPERFA